MKLGVTTPWFSPMMWTEFVRNLSRLVARFDQGEVDVHFGRGIDPASRHTDCCLWAQKNGCDLTLFIGADQIHPLDMLNRLVKRFMETGGAAIAAPVPFRGYVEGKMDRPFQPMAWRLKGEVTEDAYIPELLELVDVDAPPEFEKIDVIGTGVLLFPTEALEKLALPWFIEARDPVTMQRISDTDTQFVWRLGQEAGLALWLDKTIDVKHLHAFQIDRTYQHEHVGLVA